MHENMITMLGNAMHEHVITLITLLQYPPHEFHQKHKIPKIVSKIKDLGHKMHEMHRKDKEKSFRTLTNRLELRKGRNLERAEILMKRRG